MTAITPKYLASLKRMAANASAQGWNIAAGTLTSRYERALAEYVGKTKYQTRIQRGLAANIAAVNSAFALQLQAERQADYDADRADALALLGCM